MAVERQVIEVVGLGGARDRVSQGMSWHVLVCHRVLMIHLCCFTEALGNSSCREGVGPLHSLQGRGSQLVLGGIQEIRSIDSLDRASSCWTLHCCAKLKLGRPIAGKLHARPGKKT